MKWRPAQLLTDFLAVAKLAEIKMQPDAIRVETLNMPHRAPRNLPKGKIAVYVFSDKERVLKVGRVSTGSQPRYTSQHYNAGSAPSTLVGSILKDENVMQKYDLNKGNVSDWIKKNTDRVNFILDADVGGWALMLLEVFIQCRLQPVYEGKQYNRGRKG